MIEISTISAYSIRFWSFDVLDWQMRFLLRPFNLRVQIFRNGFVLLLFSLTLFGESKKEKKDPFELIQFVASRAREKTE